MMPLLAGASVDTSRLLVCLRISDTGVHAGKLVASADASGWQMYGNYSANGLTCVTSKNGTYVIAAVDAVDTTPPVVTPPPTVDNFTNTTNTTVRNGTVAFDGNGTACGNATVNGTLTDTNTTLTNTTDSNTTDVSPSPSPEPEPESSPSPSPDVAVETSPSPSPQPLQQGKPQTPATRLSGVLINLGVIQQCEVSRHATVVLVCCSIYFWRVEQWLTHTALADKLMLYAGTSNQQVMINCLHDMQGTYKPLAGGEARAVSTDTAGRFALDSPALSTYTFVSSGSTSCVDDVTDLPMAFPYTLVLPPLSNAAVTAIFLLTVPARSDADLLTKYGFMDEVVPEDLWTELYGMFGYQSNDKVRTRS